MTWTADRDLGDPRLRTLLPGDAALVVEATRGESAPALWGPRPVGPYTLADATAALTAWDPATTRQSSFGLIRDSRLLGAIGLIADGPTSAELAFWIRPEERGRGLARRGVQAVTSWAHQTAGLSRIWLEIDPANAASQRVAERSGYRYEQWLPLHCRSWIVDDADADRWHDCDIWVSARSVGAST